MTKRRDKEQLGLGVAFCGGGPAENRVTRDAYNTPRDGVIALARRYARTLENAVVWEPCAGIGALAATLEPWCRDVIMTDGFPMAEGIGTLDILQATEPRSDVIVTNPPFSLAPEVIAHVLGTLRPQFMALLLKATFWHAASRLDLFTRFRPTVIHPLTWRLDFLGKGSPVMDVAWNVWVEGCRTTVYEPLGKPARTAGK